MFLIPLYNIGTNDISMRSKLDSVHIGNHIIAIYQNQKTVFDDAFKFLKNGLDTNEIIMIITDRLSKEEIRNRMENEWNVPVKNLESSGDIQIKTTEEWYYSHGFPDPDKIKSFWQAMSEIARVRCRTGFRVFADTHDFFKKGYGDDLVNYESTLDSKFNFPFTAICAYDSKDIQSLTPSQHDILFAHHGRNWK
ncbi:MEDS: MEthanogen/methylotroph, DcmR Sensory domain [uncultured archaeon]|nr:MEDS: MEthanogen/methylotroph, DcmR Sensory domain [uncultured archaeon]